MRLFMFKQSAMCGVVLALMTLAVGCGEQAGDGGAPQASDVSHEDHDHGESEDEVAGHNHGGWWCAEHGVPEEVCSLCSSTAAAEFKEKGDWCEEHNRAESQCFICDPSRAEKFTKLYVAKIGEQPPKPSE